jgi:hypothetical protein
VNGTLVSVAQEEPSMSHHYQVGHENKSHEYISPMDYDETEKMRLEQDRLTKATSRQIPVRTKQVEIPRSVSYNSIP